MVLHYTRAVMHSRRCYRWTRNGTREMNGREWNVYCIRSMILLWANNKMSLETLDKILQQSQLSTSSLRFDDKGIKKNLKTYIFYKHVEIYQNKHMDG